MGGQSWGICTSHRLLSPIGLPGSKGNQPLNCRGSSSCIAVWGQRNCQTPAPAAGVWSPIQPLSLRRTEPTCSAQDVGLAEGGKPYSTSFARRFGLSKHRSGVTEAGTSKRCLVTRDFSHELQMQWSRNLSSSPLLSKSSELNRAGAQIFSCQRPGLTAARLSLYRMGLGNPPPPPRLTPPKKGFFQQ